MVKDGDNRRIRGLASGKLTLGHGKIHPFFIGKSPISMARNGIPSIAMLNYRYVVAI